MKKMILNVSVVLALVSAVTPALAAQYVSKGMACTCAELERRLGGLRLALTNLVTTGGGSGGAQLQMTIDEGNTYYRAALTFPAYSADQENSCTHGNRAVDAKWLRWQPSLAQADMDYTYSCR